MHSIRSIIALDYPMLGYSTLKYHIDIDVYNSCNRRNIRARMNIQIHMSMCVYVFAYNIYNDI